MHELSLEESKKILLEILKYIDTLCRGNNINYSLGEGTLLGAVRHNGFIPWDDDIDILMKREDMEKFLSIHKDNRYQVFHVNNDINYWNSVARISDSKTKVYFGSSTNSIHGLWVALTPLDNMPDDISLRCAQKRKISFWVNLCRQKKGVIPFEPNLIGLCKRILLRFINIKWLDKNFKKVITKYNKVPTQNLCKLNIRYEPFLIPSFLFDTYQDMKFEEIEAMVIEHYDHYLRLMYGNYMQLPPVEERIAKHNFKSYSY